MFKIKLINIFLGICLMTCLHAQSPALKVGDPPPQLNFETLSPDSTLAGLTWERLKGRVVIID